MYEEKMPCNCCIWWLHMLVVMPAVTWTKSNVGHTQGSWWVSSGCCWLCRQHLAIACPPRTRTSIIVNTLQVYSGAHGRAIVFCETKKEADLLATSDAMTADAHVLHGDIPQDKREMVLKVITTHHCRWTYLWRAVAATTEIFLTLDDVTFGVRKHLLHFNGRFLCKYGLAGPSPPPPCFLPLLVQE